MKKFITITAVVVFLGAVVAPVFAQTPSNPAPAGKGTEGPDVRRAKMKTASSVALDVIVSAEGAREEAKRHVPGRCDRP